MGDHESEMSDLESLRREVDELRTREAALAAQQELLENLIALARAAPDSSGATVSVRLACVLVRAKAGCHTQQPASKHQWNSTITFCNVIHTPQASGMPTAAQASR